MCGLFHSGFPPPGALPAGGPPPTGPPPTGPPMNMPPSEYFSVECLCFCVCVCFHLSKLSNSILLNKANLLHVQMQVSFFIF